jgi:hypothetical protein
MVAMINGERVTLKHFDLEADGIRLPPANPAMAPIYLRHEALPILGIVSGVIRRGGDSAASRGSPSGVGPGARPGTRARGRRAPAAILRSIGQPQRGQRPPAGK